MKITPNATPVGFGDIAEMAGEETWVVRDAMRRDDQSPPHRGLIRRTLWWDLTRDVLPWLQTTRFAERLPELYRRFDVEAAPTEPVNIEPVFHSVVARRFGATTQTGWNWRRGTYGTTLPEPDGVVRGEGRSGPGDRPGEWWDFRRTIQPWALAAGYLTVSVNFGTDCSACGGSGTVLLVEPTPRAFNEVVGGWQSCHRCGWTSFELATEVEYAQRLAAAR